MIKRKSKQGVAVPTPLVQPTTTQQHHHHQHSHSPPSSGCSGSNTCTAETPKFKCSTPDDFDHIPPQFVERFIFSGYRLNLTFKEAFLSLFSFHNETINIWTALLSFIVFAVVLVRVLFFWDLGSFYHSAVYAVYAISALYTFGASLFYHWFNCISHTHHACLLRLDISGIGFLILGSFYPPIYYAFHCHPNWGIFYIMLATVLCSSCSIMMLVPRFSSDAYRQFRVTVFGGAAAVGFLPIIHMFYIYGFENGYLIEKMTGIGQMYLLYLLGIIFYATKIPERFAPGKFDFLFHSHQFWHTFVFLATFAHFTNLLHVMNSFNVAPCFGRKSEFVDNLMDHFTK